MMNEWLLFESVVFGCTTKVLELQHVKGLMGATLRLYVVR